MTSVTAVVGEVHLVVREGVKHDHEHGDDDEAQEEHGIGDAERLAAEAKFHLFSSAGFKVSFILSLGMTTET